MNDLEVRFIRHATASHMLAPDLIAGRSVNAALTEDGEEEARAKGDALAARGINPDRIICSSATRCLQTGELILQAMGSDLVIEHADELLEMDQGDFVGRARAEVYDAAVQRQIHDQGRDFALPGGESMSQTGTRGINWLMSLVEKPASHQSSVLVVAHGGLITHTVGSMVGWSQPESLRRLRSMPPLGETRLVYADEQWHLETFAEPIKHI